MERYSLFGAILEDPKEATGSKSMLLAQVKLVNAQRLVHGTTNLRNVDASVMPLIPRGNIQSSECAVAGRAVDLIKGPIISRVWTFGIPRSPAEKYE
ncbi:hypothetical protein VTN02DRAFT_263 [Thermoascus thermophilus]